MSRWQSGCVRVYRRLARAFPLRFRMICGDGLEQLGEDMIPLVWREHGVGGLVRLFADLALHLPLEYFSAWMGTLKELTKWKAFSKWKTFKGNHAMANTTTRHIIR